MNKSISNIAADALWRNNVGLVQLLGLCPLLAVSTTAINAIGLGLATSFVLLLSSLFVSLIRNWLRADIRILVIVLIIAGLVTIVDLFMHAYFFDLHRNLGIFVPLIVANCAIVARAEVFAAKNKPLHAAVDGLMTGVGFAFVLLVLGALREIFGQGTLFAGAEQLLGPAGSGLSVQIFDGGFLIVALPAGAFMSLGLLIALHNIIQARRHKTHEKPGIKTVAA